MSITADDVVIQREIQKKESAVQKYKWILIPVCLLIPLGVSTMLGGDFLQSLAGDSVGTVTLRLMSLAIIFSGPIIAFLVGFSFTTGRPGRAWAGIIVVVCILIFSTSTTTMSLLKTAETKVSSQVNESDTVVDARAAIASNNATIASKQAQIDGRDAVRWASKRDGWSSDISSLNAQNAALRAEIKQAKADGEGSPVAKSFIFMEQFGITKGMLAVLAAFLMDAIPAVFMLLAGTVGGVAYSVYKKSKEEEALEGANDAAKKTQGSWWKR